MSVTLNSNGATPQPTKLREWGEQIQHDNRAINGARQRNRMGQKYGARLSWDALTPAQFQLLYGMFTAGTTVTYSNNASAVTGGSLAFTALPDFEEGEYFDGATLLKPLVVTLNEA